MGSGSGRDKRPGQRACQKEKCQAKSLANTKKKKKDTQSKADTFQVLFLSLPHSLGVIGLDANFVKGNYLRRKIKKTEGERGRGRAKAIKIFMTYCRSYYTRRKFRPIYAKVMNSYANACRKSSTYQYQRYAGANSLSLVAGLLPFTTEMALFEFPFNELLVSVARRIITVQ